MDVELQILKHLARDARKDSGQGLDKGGFSSNLTAWAIPRCLQNSSWKPKAQLPREGLVNIIVRQQQVIEQQQKAIEELTQTVNQLKVSQGLNSQTSSSPPSTDLLKKSEKALIAFNRWGKSL